ncbi:hypothetical protein C0993_004567 [Termitomyces sp. T159_Od127]|nr:hypothetical protein C0993_004567 [Termitomyces sp. T159_Od127]
MPSTLSIHNVEEYAGPSFSNDCSASPTINFNLPLPPSIETSRIKLVPFLSSVHAEPFFSIYASSPSLDRYLPISLLTFPALFSFVNTDILLDKGRVLFAIIDKTKGSNAELTESLAGMIGLLKASPQNRTVEIGPVIILPAFQGTFVSPNAVGALLKYLLDTPLQGGLGFRRVQWTANTENQASVRAAQRVGFKLEGIARWNWCLAPEKEGKEVGDLERGSAKGRDSAVLAVCWDDWENGGREHVQKLIDRP